jgi:D-aminoacyl-tRNA deacylase
MLGVVVSRADDASVHIGEHLLDLADWDRLADRSRPDAEGGGVVYRTDDAVLREFDELHLHTERVADAFGDVDLLVFASKHAGETGPLLTAHHTGNLGPADHGGDPNDLARACPNAHARVLAALAEHAPEGYEVGMECTHHGPTDVGAPSMFVEVGSGQPEWDDPAAARAVARAIFGLRGVSPDCGSEDGRADGEAGPADAYRRHLVGIGGGHYAPRFERVVRETDWAVGHVAADWGLDALDEHAPGSRTVLDQLFAESRAAYALVDGDRPGVEAAVADLGYRAVSETWVRETDGVGLGLVRAVEDAVATVEAGLRFGERARDHEGGFVVVDLPAELLDEARGIGREATRALFRAETLAFVTDQGGTRVTGPAVLSDPADREAVVDGLLAVLRERYDSVERADGEVVACEVVFDPDRARTLGVPEGPKFGRLAAGEPVEVDGEEIPPAAVREERERRFPLE